ncbi:hypothetical protein [Sphingobacterium kitahiroshimense]|uniref:hypothetical protein n=1 Tax=Sphingobacterium kitahiroshimense TaxID=470446 RepID=UPI003207AFB6
MMDIKNGTCIKIHVDASAFGNMQKPKALHVVVPVATQIGEKEGGMVSKLHVAAAC